jgi:heme oxygenase (mycobilin-producing)
MTLLVVTRYVVDDPAGGESGGESGGEAFRLRARDALEALTAQPGCTSGHVARALDDPRRWVVQTEWDSVGSYRRALSAYDVKVRAVPLMYEQIDEATAYESLVTAGPDGLADSGSDLAAGAAWATPRRAHDGAQPGRADR